MEEIKPIKGDLSEAIKQIIKMQEELINKLKYGNLCRIPKSHFGQKTDKNEK